MIMPETDRLTSCDNGDCQPLNSFDDRLCVGRLRAPQKHLELSNTHRLCFDADEYQINAADAYYLASLMIEVIKDVKDLNLYDPCGQLAINDPVRRLKERLGP